MATRRTTTKARGGLAKPVKPDAALAKIVGDEPQPRRPRSEITKRIWDYVTKHRLQDEKNRRMIRADDQLKPAFDGKARVSMFEMTKLVNKHVRD